MDSAAPILNELFLKISVMSFFLAILGIIRNLITNYIEGKYDERYEPEVPPPSGTPLHGGINFSTDWDGCTTKCTVPPGVPDVSLDDPVILLKGTPITMREFSTGATRNDDSKKFDYEGFLSPLVVHQFADYMHTHRKQADGKLRDSDNWQKGIPLTAYMKSMLRHVMDFWRLHRGHTVTDPDSGKNVTKIELLMAILFNVQGYAHELLKTETTCQPLKIYEYGPNPSLKYRVCDKGVQWMGRGVWTPSYMREADFQRDVIRGIMKEAA